MSGVTICAWCGSADTQQQLDNALCLSCGKLTHADGSKDLPAEHEEE